MNLNLDCFDVILKIPFTIPKLRIYGEGGAKLFCILTETIFINQSLLIEKFSAWLWIAQQYVHITLN